jgi:hypothetical protein
MCLTERVTRYSLLITMPNGYSSADALAGLDGLERRPAHLRRSIMFDQGSEWAQWPALVQSYELDAWFCDPHSPWQRGQIENLNRQWRWWFRRGTNLAGTSPTEAGAAGINGQRRRGLDYQSPATLCSSNGSQDQHPAAHPKANTSRSLHQTRRPAPRPATQRRRPAPAPIGLRRALAAIDHTLTSYINDSRLGTAA